MEPHMSWIKSIFSLISGKAWAAIWAVAGVFAVWAVGRKSGKDAVISKQAQKSVKAARKANEIRDKNTAAPVGDVVRRLRKYERK